MADISYTPTTWANGAEGGTAIDAAKLNNIESGIVDAVAAIGLNDTTEDGTLKAQIDTLGTLSNRLRMANDAKRLRVDEWSTGFQIGVFNSTAENSGYLVNFEFSTGTITGYTVTGGATTFAFSIHKDA